jgi:primosomal protein N' (replication factor Y)
MVVEVAVPLPIRGTYFYTLPIDDSINPQVGCRVLVPFQNRHLIGVIVSLAGSDRSDLKEVIRILDPNPIIPGKLVELGRWLSWYYLAPLGESLRIMLPPGVLTRKASPDSSPEDFWPAKKQWAVTSCSGSAENQKLTASQKKVFRLLLQQQFPVLFRHLSREFSITSTSLRSLENKGLITNGLIDLYRSPWHEVRVPDAKKHPLTSDQKEILDKLEAPIQTGGFKSILLHGVTASGKTEIYLQAIQSVLNRGKSGLVLVPEIALTPQVSRQFRSWFGSQVAILHSALSRGERFDQWRRIREGRAKVAVGTRSAVFAPLQNLGLIIVDEEHDTSYKQSEQPRYNARDTAVKRAQLEGALVVLGSATPALETFHNATTRGTPQYIVLKKRVHQKPLPAVQLIDMRIEFERHGKAEIISDVLKDALRDRLKREEQALILLNRRGYASSCMCRSCGHFENCINCSITLTYHQEFNQLSCHYCGYSKPVPQNCPDCNKTFVFMVGYGTEKVQESLQQLLQGAVIDRLDRDTVQRKGSYERILGAFRRKETDILVGTQMLAKGHDFPAVTLVGVLGADQGLKFADFRAAERTFQLLTQVAGRAGRGEIPGEVIIQTFYPHHYSLRTSITQEYEQFSNQELKYRQSLRYPPFVALASILVRGNDFESVWGTARSFAKLVIEIRDEISSRTRMRIFGPAAAAIERLKKDFRVQILVKSNDRILIHELLLEALRRCPERNIDLRKISIDIDPVDLL